MLSFSGEEQFKRKHPGPSTLVQPSSLLDSTRDNPIVISDDDEPALPVYDLFKRRQKRVKRDPRVLLIKSQSEDTEVDEVPPPTKKDKGKQIMRDARPPTPPPHPLDLLSLVPKRRLPPLRSAARSGTAGPSRHSWSGSSVLSVSSHSSNLRPTRPDPPPAPKLTARRPAPASSTSDQPLSSGSTNASSSRTTRPPLMLTGPTTGRAMPTGLNPDDADEYDDEIAQRAHVDDDMLGNLPDQNQEYDNAATLNFFMEQFFRYTGCGLHQHRAMDARRVKDIVQFEEENPDVAVLELSIAEMALDHGRALRDICPLSQQDMLKRTAIPAVNSAILQTLFTGFQYSQVEGFAVHDIPVTPEDERFVGDIMVSLDLDKSCARYSDPTDIFEITYDIDSILAKPTSLAVCRKSFDVSGCQLGMIHANAYDSFVLPRRA